MPKHIFPKLIFIFLLFFVVAFSVHAADTTPTKIKFTPKVLDIKGFGGEITISGGTIGQMISALYNYAVGIVGILAAVVLMFGGILYLTAGGDTTQTGEAKKYIAGAISGVVIVMTSYLMLSIINPDLVTFKDLNITKITGGAAVGGGGINTGDKSKACQTMAGNNNYVDFYQKINNTQATYTSLPPGCARYDDFFKSAAATHNLDYKLLKAIAAAESSCAPGAGSGAGACGIMQLMPATAGKTCEWLKDPNNVAESINIAAQYIKKNSAGNNTADIIAGYNGGYGTNSSSGKTPALASSKDCPGRKAYECCINAAGLKETQDYVVKVWNYSASRQ